MRFSCSRAHHLGILLLMVPILWGSWNIHGSPRIGIDDANIFWVYAENVLQGQGLTYGGQGLLVEGFTSPLWLFLSVLVFALGLGVTGVLVLAALLGVGCLNVVGAIGRRWCPESLQGWLGFWVPVLIIVLQPATVFWLHLTGMDVALWTFLLFLFSWLILEKGLNTARWCIPFLVFTRPESLLVVPVLIGSYVVVTRQLRSRKSWLSALGLWAGSWGVLWTLRWLIYESWWPNTYYAKVDPSLDERLVQGSEYLLNFFFEQPAMIPLLLCCIGWSLFGVVQTVRNISLGPSHMEITWFSMTALLLMAVPVLNGGDHFVMYRMFQPAVPFLSVVGATSILYGVSFFFRNVRFANRFHGTAVAGLCLIIGFGFHTFQRWPWARLVRAGTSPLKREFVLATRGYESGKSLENIVGVFHSQPRLGVVVAGAVARSYEGPVIDLMGLNHPDIGRSKGGRSGIRNHAAFRKQFLWDYRVEILLADPDHDFMQTVLDGVFSDPAFVKDYRFGILGREGEYSPEVFVHRDTLQRLKLYGIPFQEKRVWTGMQWATVVEAEP